MREELVSFGDQHVLRGIFSHNPPLNTEHSRPCIVFLNSGLVSQAGPARLYVELARALAQQGFNSLRFDLSGIGDSDKHRDNRPYQEQIAGDIKAALDLVEEKQGNTRFILLGICTGADNAHKTAVNDPRVTGIVLMDGYAYKTAGFYRRHYLKKLSNPVHFLPWLKRTLSAQAMKLNPASSELKTLQALEKEDYYWSVPPKNKTLKELKLLIARNVEQLHIFSGEWSWCYNHKKQFANMYRSIDFKNTAQSIFFAQSDHTYTLLDDRIKLIKTVTDWTEHNFPQP